MEEEPLQKTSVEEVAVEGGYLLQPLEEEVAVEAGYLLQPLVEAVVEHRLTPEIGSLAAVEERIW